MGLPNQHTKKSNQNLSVFHTLEKCVILTLNKILPEKEFVIKLKQAKLPLEKHDYLFFDGFLKNFA
ncbi:hypothetical protein BpHYR1_035587 [Brachionus plicatilis]|uniref:Uncharacterized protein n=1 Tax=Brachionus plicatilis TaxID=10195 RepID=A0A3M7RAK5_BRAPC|nr:hypothetical protein BpHYR1_035587 [Brachionus plicatilis]